MITPNKVTLLEQGLKSLLFFYLIFQKVVKMLTIIKHVQKLKYMLITNVDYQRLVELEKLKEQNK